MVTVLLIRDSSSQGLEVFKKIIQNINWTMRQNLLSIGQSLLQVEPLWWQIFQQTKTADLDQRKRSLIEAQFVAGNNSLEIDLMEEKHRKITRTILESKCLHSFYLNNI